MKIDACGWQATLEELVRSTKKERSYSGSGSWLFEIAAQSGRQFLQDLTGRDAELTAPQKLNGRAPFGSRMIVVLLCKGA